MELGVVRNLLLLAHNGSITATARGLNLTPSAVHKQLRALESELGVKVYEKTGQRLRLTQAGLLLVPHFKAIAEHLDAAAAEVEDLNGSRRGVVRLGGGASMVHYLFPPVLRRYRQEFPAVDVLVEAAGLGGLVDSLRRGTIDLAFGTAEALAQPDMEIVTRWPFEMVFVANKTFPEGKTSLANLQKHPFVSYPPGFALLEDYFRGHGFAPRVSMRFDSADALKAMVESGLGISIVPLWTVNRDVSEGRIRVVEVKEPPIFAHLALFRRKGAYVSRPVQQFVDLIRKHGFGRNRLMWHKAPA